MTMGNPRRVVVTGIGLTTPFGMGSSHNWQKLISGLSATKALCLQKFNKLPCQVAALVPRGESETEFNELSQFTKSECRMFTTATMLALVTAKEAVDDSRLMESEELQKDRVGVAIGTGMQDLQEISTAAHLLQNRYSSLSPYFIPKTLANMSAGQISIKYGFMGPNHSVSTACATGCHAIGDAFRFIKYNDADAMICGGTESNISPLSVAGFCRLRALSVNYNDKPESASRPFDCKRDGFVMGEGAGIVILEELTHALKRNAKIYGEIFGYGTSGDAHHITSPREDGKGAILAMSKSIKEANMKREDVKYINAHATSTPIGDAIEISAIKTLFQDHSKRLHISSTKGAIGHLLGAAGAVETIFTILSCHSAHIPPTVNLYNASDGFDLDLVPLKSKPWLQESTRRVALCNSFGFGGTNATLCISSFE